VLNEGLSSSSTWVLDEVTSPVLVAFLKPFLFLRRLRRAHETAQRGDCLDLPRFLEALRKLDVKPSPSGFGIARQIDHMLGMRALQGDQEARRKKTQAQLVAPSQPRLYLVGAFVAWGLIKWCLSQNPV
jgi:hypothetical protein